MFDHHDRARLERMEVTVTLLSNRLDRLMASAQQILDGAQNATAASQNLTTAVVNLAQRVENRPVGVLTEAEAETVNTALGTIASDFTAAAATLDQIAPAV